MKKICLYFLMAVFALCFTPVKTFGATAAVSEMIPLVACTLSGFTSADLYSAINTPGQDEDFSISCQIDSNNALGFKVLIGSENTSKLFNTTSDFYTPVNYGVTGSSFWHNSTSAGNVTSGNVGYTVSNPANTIAGSESSYIANGDDEANTTANLFILPVASDTSTASMTQVLTVVPKTNQTSVLSMSSTSIDNLVINFEANFNNTTDIERQYAKNDDLIVGTYTDTIHVMLIQLGGNTSPKVSSQNAD